MSYATVTDMLDRFNAEELAQRADRAQPRIVDVDMLRLSAAAEDMTGYTQAEQDAAAAAVAIIQRALNDAISTADGYISGRHPVPLADPPAYLNLVVCDLARFFLYDDAVTGVIADRHKDAIAWLKGVASGANKIGPQTGGEEQPTTGSAEMVSSTPVFRREDSTGFI